MKKKLLLLALALACLSCLFAVTVSATDDTPTLSVNYTNLSFKDSVYIKYAVAAENVAPEDVRLLVFTEPQDDYTDESKATVLMPKYLDTVNGAEHIIFDYTNLAARQMTDEVYARAMVKVGNKTYYSNIKKYSILQYAISAINNPSAKQSLKNMLAGMLDYGALAQTHFAYEADRLANASWVSITVVNGTHTDGFTTGMFITGDTLTLTPAEAPAGKVFSHWVNAAGEPQTLPLTAPAKNETYTAVYECLHENLYEEEPTCSKYGFGECLDCGVIFTYADELGHPIPGMEKYYIMPHTCMGYVDGQMVDYCHTLKHFEADCTNSGYDEFKCIWCEEIIQTNLVDPLGHDEIDHEAKAPTCTEDGYEAYVTCTRCDYTTYTVVPSKGHVYVNGSCTGCGIIDLQLMSDLTLIERGNDDYAYEYFGTMANGENLQKLYKDIDSVAVSFHLNYDLNIASDLLIAMLNYADYGLSAEEAVSVWNMYRNDHPLFYWMSNSVGYTSTDLLLYVDELYTDGSVREEYNQLILLKVREYLNITMDETSPYQITLAYHDTIIKAIDYAYEADGRTPEDDAWAHNILGVFEKGKGVCESYARTFQLLLNLKGVENVFVTGTGNNEDHAWNMAQMDDGEWYWFDLTWDDTPSWMWGISYNYFCVNDSQIVNWSDGGWVANSTKTFLDTHTYNLPTNPNVLFLYELPERASSTYEGQATLRSTFSTDGFTFAHAGYRSLQLVKIEQTGEVTVPETVTWNGKEYTVISIGTIDSDGLFGISSVMNADITSIQLSKNILFIWDDALGAYNGSLEAISVAEDNPYFASVDGVLFTKDGYTLISYPAAKKSTTYIIPDKTVEVAYYAFYDLQELETLVIGKNVVRFGMCNWGGSGYSNLVLGGIPRLRYYAKKSNFAISVLPESHFVIVDDCIYSADKNMFYGPRRSATAHKIEIAQGTKSIDDRAFWGCQQLFSVTIPESITEEPGVIFPNSKVIEIYNCSTVNLEHTDGVKNIYTPTSGESKLIILDDCLFYIGEDTPIMIAYLGQDTSITLPADCKGETYVLGLGGVNRELFFNVDVESITIPTGVTSIGMFAFLDCTSITSITISDSVTSIGSCAFDGCTSLTSVTFGEHSQLTSIDDCAFQDCTSLASIEIPDSVTSIGDYAFDGCTSLASVTFGENSQLTSIGSSAFSGCTSLTSITIPDHVTSIGNYAFSGCTSLASIEIPDRVTSIGYNAFADCSSLTNITIPDRVTSIGNHAFYNCTSLVSIKIPDGVTSISSLAFYNCTSLKSATIPAIAISIIPKNNLKTVVITSGTSIPYRAFYNCVSLASIAIPDSVTSIGNNAFWGCTSLVNVTIGSGVTSIGVSAFEGCTSLLSITFGENSKLTSIDGEAFEGCTSLTSVTFGEHSKLTSIGYAAFRDCTSLTSIEIPDSVTSIGNFAFSGCTSLTTVYYGGTAEDWSTITIGYYNSYLTDATRYYYSETQPAEEGNYWRYVDGVPTAW